MSFQINNNEPILNMKTPNFITLVIKDLEKTIASFYYILTSPTDNKAHIHHLAKHSYHPIGIHRINHRLVSL